MQISSPPRIPSPKARKLLFTYEGFAQIQLILGAAFALIGLPVLVFCSLVLAEEIHLWGGALEVSAKITSVGKPYKDEADDSRVDVSYEYQQQNETFSGKAALSVKDSAEIFTGQPMRITASQTVPGVSREPGLDAYSGPAILIVVLGLPFSVIGLWFLLGSITKMRRRLRAYTQGSIVTAKVLSAGDDMNTQIHYQHPYLITWEFEANGKTHKGSFSSMDKPQLAALVASQELLVAYLPERPDCNSLYLP
jgi:hypothetical protein